MLRAKYGEHPVLLETAADFTEDASEQVALYERAKRAAITGRLPTCSIRIALARVLVEELNQPARASQELLDCQAELADYADEAERQEWSELWKACGRLAQRRA